MYNIDVNTALKLAAKVHVLIQQLEQEEGIDTNRRVHTLRDLHKRLEYHRQLSSMVIGSTSNTITISRRDVEAVYAS